MEGFKQRSCCVVGGPAWSVAGSPGGSLVQSSRQETVGAGAGVADGDSEDKRFLGGETHRTW